ncbi:MAG: HAD family hydrolase [Endomicrobiales bacterium]
MKIEGLPTAITTPILSCDVFDTVLTRMTGEPRGIFLLMQRKLKSSDGLPRELAENFLEERVSAERETREHTVREEVTLWEIYDALGEKFSLDSPTRRMLMDREMEEESLAVRAVPEPAALIDRARAAGRKIIFVSDTYLPGSFVFGLLQRAGAALPGDTLYASSDLLLTKSSGNLFRYVLENEKCAGSSVTHIGDNFHSDNEAARALGIRTVLFTGARLNRYERTMAGSGTRALSTVYPGQVLSGSSRLARLHNPLTTPSHKTLRDIGASLAGPLLLGYVQWVLSQARKRGLQRLYFLSRDGQVLLEIARRLNAIADQGMELRYLYGSRQAWHLPAVESTRPEELDWLFEADPLLTLRIFSRRAGLEPDTVAGELSRVTGRQWDKDTPLGAAGITLLRDRLAGSAIPGQIRSQAQKARAAAQKYFKQEGLVEGKAFGMVDLGWKGSLQDSLQKILASSAVPPAVSGFYFGLNCSVTEAGNSTKAAFFFSPGAPPLVLHTGRRFANILEVFTAADHGTTESYYQDTAGQWKPRLKEQPGGAGADWGLAALREGIFSCVEAATPALLQDMEAHLDEYRGILLSCMRQFLFTPSRDEAEAVGEYRFSSDQAETYLRAFAPRLSLGAALRYSVAGWHGKVNLSHWREGTRSRSALLPRLVLHPLVQDLCSLLNSPGSAARSRTGNHAR